MSTNKNATIRYRTLDRCFRNPGRRYCMADMLAECNEALLDIDPASTGINRRQVYYDILFMRDSRGFDAPIESVRDGQKVYYRYSDLSFSINNQPINEQEAQQMKEFLLTLSRFKGMPQFEWMEEMKARLEQTFKLKTAENILSFEENSYLTGREFIGELYNAIVNQMTLIIEYKPFKLKHPIQFYIHPYHLKQYNNRWFLFGENEEHEIITNIALDRIISITPSKTPYKPNTEIDFEEYFEDVIGVTMPYNEETQNNEEVQKIILKIAKEQWPYIKTKPLHGSQKPPKIETDEYVVIELKLIPNFELESLILSYGDTVEVIEPESLRIRISEKIKRLFQIYDICAD